MANDPRMQGQMGQTRPEYYGDDKDVNTASHKSEDVDKSKKPGLLQRVGQFFGVESKPKDDRVELGSSQDQMNKDYEGARIEQRKDYNVSQPKEYEQGGPAPVRDQMVTAPIPSDELGPSQGQFSTKQAVSGAVNVPMTGESRSYVSTAPVSSNELGSRQGFSTTQASVPGESTTVVSVERVGESNDQMMGDESRKREDWERVNQLEEEERRRRMTVAAASEAALWERQKPVVDEIAGGAGAAASGEIRKQDDWQNVDRLEEQERLRRMTVDAPLEAKLVQRQMPVVAEISGGTVNNDSIKQEERELRERVARLEEEERSRRMNDATAAHMEAQVVELHRPVVAEINQQSGAADSVIESTMSWDSVEKLEEKERSRRLDEANGLEAEVLERQLPVIAELGGEQPGNSIFESTMDWQTVSYLEEAERLRRVDTEAALEQEVLQRHRPYIAELRGRERGREDSGSRSKSRATTNNIEQQRREQENRWSEPTEVKHERVAMLHQLQAQRAQAAQAEAERQSVALEEKLNRERSRAEAVALERQRTKDAEIERIRAAAEAERQKQEAIRLEKERIAALEEQRRREAEIERQRMLEEAERQRQIELQAEADRRVAEAAELERQRALERELPKQNALAEADRIVAEAAELERRRKEEEAAVRREELARAAEITRRQRAEQAEIERQQKIEIEAERHRVAEIERQRAAQLEQERRQAEEAEMQRQRIEAEQRERKEREQRELQIRLEKEKEESERLRAAKIEADRKVAEAIEMDKQLAQQRKQVEEEKQRAAKMEAEVQQAQIAYQRAQEEERRRELEAQEAQRRALEEQRKAQTIRQVTVSEAEPVLAVPVVTEAVPVVDVSYAPPRPADIHDFRGAPADAYVGAPANAYMASAPPAYTSPAPVLAYAPAYETTQVASERVPIDSSAAIPAQGSVARERMEGEYPEKRADFDRTVD